MVMVCNEQFSMDGYLKSALDDLQTYVNKKWDGVGFFAGFEGDGKTTIAMQCALYVDPTFNLDRVVFTSRQFKDAIKGAKKHEAIVFDESYMSFTSKRHNSREQAELIAILTTIRKKQLYIFFVAPSFFDINKYLAIFRSRFLINVYANEFTRGFFNFYSRTKKKDLYIKGKKFEDMSVVKPNFFGRFTGFEPLPMDEYEKKKDEAINELLGHEEKKASNIDKRNEMIFKMHKKLKSYERVGELVGISKSQIQRIVKDFESSNGFAPAPARP